MTTTPTRVGMPLDEFIEAFNQQPFELIHGERVPKLPTGEYEHSDIIHIIFMAIVTFLAAHKLSGTARIETTFILPERQDANWVKGSRVPDMLFYAGNRLDDYLAGDPTRRKRPLALVPDLVVEVISPTDKYSEVNEKVQLYLLDGVRIVWVVDPQQRNVTIFTADNEQPTLLKGEAALDGADVLPDFRLPLDEVFK